MAHIGTFWDTIVIGGGPGGMFAAYRSASLGRKTLLLEKNPSLGKKLLITGGGRCNFTNAEKNLRTFAEKFGREGKALISLLHQFSPEDCLDWFQAQGMAYKVEVEQRAFPQSDKAESVLHALQKAIREVGVKVLTHKAVRSLEPQEEGLRVMTAGESFLAHRVILATGGLARPETGSTGEGLQWLKQLGIKVQDPDPSLVPITLREKAFGALMGVSFLDCGVKVYRDGKKIQGRRGKLLFAHFGLSGPLILNMSRFLYEESKKGTLTLALDFFPEQSMEAWEKGLQEALDRSPKKKLASLLKGTFPAKMLGLLLQELAISEKPANQVTKAERKALCSWAKDLRLTFEGILGPDKAIVSSGGVDLTEVDFKTMGLKKIPSLRVVGDLLNFNRPSGGFSLQVCWSTGWVAGS
jgi:predicted Rossmann fold flavoprotein